MSPCPDSSADLASYLDQTDMAYSHQADPGGESGTDLHDLLTLARQLRELSPVEPDPAWLEASKRALLSRFEELNRPT